MNLADNTATGTLTAVTQKIAFGAGATKGLGTANGDLQYGAGSLSPNPCTSTQPVAVVPTPLVSTTNTPSQAVLSCAPINLGSLSAPKYSAMCPFVNNEELPCSAPGPGLPAIFWEPDNLRGRALASFDAQVGPADTSVSGVITPMDYIVGTWITDNFGLGIVPQGVAGITGQAATSATVTVTAFTTAAPFTVTVSIADPNFGKLALGMVLVESSGSATITAIDPVGGVITLSSQGLPTGTTTPALVTFGTSFGSTPTPPTAGIATRYYIQPVAFSCPAGNLFRQNIRRGLLRLR